MMARKWVFVAATVVVCGLTAACTTQPVQPEAAPVTVTVTAPAPKPTPLVLAPSSLDDFKSMLQGVGLQCEDWQETSEVTGQCNDLVVLTVRGDSDEMYGQAFDLAYRAIRDQGRDDVALLVGDGCFVRVSTGDAKYLQGQVGGAVVN